MCRDASFILAVSPICGFLGSAVLFCSPISRGRLEKRLFRSCSRGWSARGVDAGCRQHGRCKHLPRLADEEQGWPTTSCGCPASRPLSRASAGRFAPLERGSGRLRRLSSACVHLLRCPLRLALYVLGRRGQASRREKLGRGCSSALHVCPFLCLLVLASLLLFLSLSLSFSVSVSSVSLVQKRFSSCCSAVIACSCCSAVIARVAAPSWLVLQRLRLRTSDDSAPLDPSPRSSVCRRSGRTTTGAPATAVRETLAWLIAAILPIGGLAREWSWRRPMRQRAAPRHEPTRQLHLFRRGIRRQWCEHACDSEQTPRPQARRKRAAARA